MFEHLEQLENSLVQAGTMADCDQALSHYLNKKGISTFSFTYYAYHPNSANKLKYDMCSANFRAWHQHYLAEQYNNIDSTLSFVYTNSLPIYWNLKQQVAQATSERERKMRSERTINFHIQKINKKLGTKNKYQSLAKALEHQLLTL